MDNLFDRYWFQSEAPLTRIGLSVEFAETVEGDWVGLELAPPGTQIRTHESFGFITTHLATHDLRAPCPFRIVEVNAGALANPSVVRLSPAGDGWLLMAVETEQSAAV